MVIGFDGKRAVSNMTGLGNYSRLVIEQLALHSPTDRFLVYTPKIKDNPRLEIIRSLHNVEFRLPAAQGFQGSLWRSFGIPNNLAADGVDVYHGLSNELPLNIRKSGVASVVTMHDVIYRTMPECYKPIDRFMYDFKYGHSCRNADRIIAVSECTKRDVCRFYQVDPGMVDVIYQGCDESFKRIWTGSELSALRQRLQLPQKYILQVGTIEQRKNLELTIRALSALPEDVALVVVGKDHHGYKKKVDAIAAELGVANRIHYYSGLDFKDLPGVNQAAEVIAYPSRYEGFGIPVLEGLESCRPVVAATGSCLEEAGGEMSLYVNPDSPREMAEALNSLLDGTRDIKAITAAGKEHAARFDKKNMASQINETYRKAMDSHKFNAKKFAGEEKKM